MLVTHRKNKHFKQTNSFNWKGLSPQMRYYLANSNSFINLAVGTVRSGKTITTILRFFGFMIRSPHNEFAIIGKSINTIDRNVMQPFMKILNGEHIQYLYKKGDQVFYFLDNVVYLFGLDKEGAEDKIQGATLGGAFVDEASVITESGFNMLKTRLSLEGAKIFATSNPASKNHFLFTGYINNPDMDETTCKIFNFKLDDNPSLSENQINNIKSSFQKGSLFYQRFIEGKWVSGHGAIFTMFNDENLLKPEDKSKYNYYKIEIGSDYGTTNMTCYSVIGICEVDGHREYHLLDEFFYDATREEVRQTDDERVNDVYKLQEKHHLDRGNVFYASHDAENFKTALEKDARIKMSIKTFKPDTLECIAKLSELFNKNELKIYNHCTETIKQIKSYEWDNKKSMKGLDVPVKVDDHLIDSMRAPIMVSEKSVGVKFGVVHF